jgi:GTP-binding protein
MKFIDEATIEVRSGNGGRGAVAFMRQKYMPKMGPSGGDGGAGGNVYFEATHDLQSLLDFKFQPHYAAENGEAGASMDCNGRGGKDLTLRVPVGTVLRDAESGQFLADLVEAGKPVLVLKGGRGGLGNMNFATAARQAPDFAQPGEPGVERRIKLELKLLADVALVGFPNAGKSTLISRWSAAKPKIANYPFTTLVPNLGVVRGKSLDFVLADIPGIIEGAADGKGLGIRFLKHAERTRAIVMMMDLDPFTGRDLVHEYRVLCDEMAAFSRELVDRPRLVALNKIDALGTELEERGVSELKALLAEEGRGEPFLISAVTGQGLDPLKDALESELARLGPRETRNLVESSLQLGDVSLFEDEE